MRIQLLQSLALETARSSSHPMFRLGSVLLVGTECISAANLASGVKGVAGVCAETRLLRKLPRRFNRPGGVLFVARVTKSGDVAMARPCTMCQQWIKRRGIGIVWYTCQDGSWCCERFN